MNLKAPAYCGDWKHFENEDDEVTIINDAISLLLF